VTTSSSVVPRVTDLVRVNPRETSFMRVLSPARGEDAAAVSRWTPLPDIAPVLVSAVVRAEDPRFFEHHGIDVTAIRRLLVDALRRGRLRGGGSTITQQLARNLYLTPARSIVRKVREMILAIRVDRAVPKLRVLELYLNLAEWGPGVWGCAAAADYYFDKAPRDLDLFESTFLVTLLPAPRSQLSGSLAPRSRQVQLSIAHQLLLSGQTTAAACGACSARIRELHTLLGHDVPLRAALRRSRDARTGADAEFVEDLIADLHLEPLPPDQLLTARCADLRQQQAAVRRLLNRFGPEALMELLATGSYAKLIDHPAAPVRHARRPGA
jgi:monofunctional biosynthetic peptidoglycan transglycosylase